MTKSNNRKAGDALKSFSFRGKVDEKSQYYSTNKSGERELTDIKEDSNPFKVDSLKDFDTTAYGIGSAQGKEVVNANDLRGLHKQGGFSIEDLGAYTNKMESQGIRVGSGAQNFLNRKLGLPAESGGGGNSGGSSNKPKTGVGASGISSHQDIADRYSAKIDADFAKDEADFNVQDRINAASENVQSKVNADDRFKGLYQSVTNMSDYYRNSSDRTRLGIFGDMWNTRSSSWKSPGTPEKIETNYDKD